MVYDGGGGAWCIMEGAGCGVWVRGQGVVSGGGAGCGIWGHEVGGRKGRGVWGRGVVYGEGVGGQERRHSDGVSRIIGRRRGSEVGRFLVSFRGLYCRLFSS